MTLFMLRLYALGAQKLGAAVFANDIAAVEQCLKEQPSSLNETDKYDRDALDYAVDDRVNFAVFKALLDAGGRLAAGNGYLGYSICNGHDIEPPGVNGRGKSEIRGAQLQKFKYVYAMNPAWVAEPWGDRPRSPFYIAVTYGRTDLVTYMHGKGIDDYDALGAAFSDYDLLTLLLSWKYPLHRFDDTSELVAACGSSDPRCVNLLLRLGINASGSRTADLPTPLFALALNRRMSPRNEVKLIRIFIDRGMPINAISTGGVTALYLAVKRAQPAVCDIVLESGMRDVRNGGGIPHNAYSEAVKLFQILDHPDSSFETSFLKDAALTLKVLIKRKFCSEADLLKGDKGDPDKGLPPRSFTG